MGRHRIVCAGSNMTRKAPLQSFPALRTREPDELRERMAPLYAVSAIEVPRVEAKFDAQVNHVEFRSIGLSYARYGCPLEAVMSNTNFYAQGFGLRGSGEVVLKGQTFTVAGGKGGTGGPGESAKLKYGAGFEHLIMKIRPDALVQKLSALLGAPVVPPLKLTGRFDEQGLEAERYLLRFVISELDRSKGALPPLLLAELEQALIVAYLCANDNNYSRLLNERSPDAAPWQVRRTEEYIAANWDQPITIETLAFITQTSARSLFASFKKHRGYSPMNFVKRVRLQRARAMLERPDVETSVTSIAFACGFSNLGHFAKDYFFSFGELPSETLKVSKRSNGS